MWRTTITSAIQHHISTSGCNLEHTPNINVANQCNSTLRWYQLCPSNPAQGTVHIWSSPDLMKNVKNEVCTLWVYHVHWNVHWCPRSVSSNLPVLWVPQSHSNPEQAPHSRTIRAAGQIWPNISHNAVTLADVPLNDHHDHLGLIDDTPNHSNDEHCPQGKTNLLLLLLIYQSFPMWKKFVAHSPWAHGWALIFF